MLRSRPLPAGTQPAAPLNFMRILVDATAVNDGGGGICTFFLGLLSGWVQAGFNDEWRLVGMRDLPQEIGRVLEDRGTLMRYGRPSPVRRIATQQMVVPFLARRRNWTPDVILAATPVIPVTPMAKPTVAIVYDLRSLRYPGEFGVANRAYRRFTYLYGLRRADGLVAISAFTGDEVAEYAPKRVVPARVVPLGADHVDEWPRPPVVEGQGITFAHWSNKRPDVAIGAWRLLRDSHPAFSGVLHVVGADASGAAALTALSEELDMVDRVRIHPFLPENEYRTLFASSAVVVMPSTMEGFGLPVTEAQRLGIPVVASAVPGMVEAGGDAAFFSSDNSPASFAQLCAIALFDSTRRQDMIARGGIRAERLTWQKTAEALRPELLRVRSRAAHHPAPVG